MNGNINDSKQLQIRQQNINKSLITTSNLLNNTPPNKFDIIAIQEPYLDHLRNARANSKSYSVYPKTHYSNKSKCTRSMILVNKKLATDTSSIIDIRSPDITAIKMKTLTGTIFVIIIYCECSHSESIVNQTTNYRNKINTMAYRII